MRKGRDPTLLRGVLRSVIAISAILLVAAFALLGNAASVEKKNVKLMLDWIIEGTHAPFFIPLAKGYYQTEGLNVHIDPGSGAQNTVADVASGVYDFGWADIPTMIAFDAQNPGKELTLVYVSFEDSPLAVVSLKKAKIKSLGDLAGKTVITVAGGATNPLFDFLVRAAKIEVHQKFVAPQLREPLLLRGGGDAELGFDVSTVFSLVALGVPLDQIRVLPYSSLGLTVYGTGLWARHAFIESHPSTVAAMVRAINHGTEDAIADPCAAAHLITKYNPLLKPDVEYQRLLMALHHDVNRGADKHGLSYVVPAEMQKTIDLVVKTEHLTHEPALDQVWTGKFLPREAERIPPKFGMCKL